MIRPAWTLTGCLALAALFGCGEAPLDSATIDTSQPEAAAPEAPAADTPAVEEQTTETEAVLPVEEIVLSEEEIAEIKKLPEDEAALALKQKVCPISEEHLGSMDKPVKMTAEGKTVFLCCGGCKKTFNRDPKAALAKLGLDKDQATGPAEATP